MLGKLQEEMLHTVAVLICLCLTCAVSTDPGVPKETWYELSLSRAGAGEVVGVEENVTATDCAIECSMRESCNCATLDPTPDLDKHTCSLLHVAHPEDDWRHSPHDAYMCANPPTDFTSTSHVAFWPFQDDTASVWATNTVLTAHNTPFVAAAEGGNSNVLSLLGDKDSYIALENNGDLAVTSFTWMVKLFPENTNGPLFNWELSDGENFDGRLGPHIWLESGRLLFVMTQNQEDATQPIPIIRAHHPTVLTLNAWHDVAVSYDYVTGYAQLRTDDVTETYSVGTMGNGHTNGAVQIGSWYHFSGTAQDSRSVQGKIACMRVWRVYRDLASITMDSPICNIN